MRTRIGKAITVMAVLFMTLSTGPAGAMDHGKHGGHGGAGAQHIMGDLMAERTVSGYTLSYYLLGKADRDKMMKGMEGMEMHGMSAGPDLTHHLMLYIKGPDGKPASGKIGFIITGPEGKEFKTLTMGMHGGYGADVVLTPPGTYAIKTKAVVDGNTIEDQFEYLVK